MKHQEVSTAQRMPSLRMLALLLMVCFSFTLMYFFRYELDEKAMIVINSLSYTQDIRTPSSSESSPKPEKMTSLPKQIPMVPGLTDTSKLIPNWLSSVDVVDLKDVNHPPIQDIEMNKSIMVTACPEFFQASIKDPKPVYHLCDRIELVITARNCKNENLNNGGDFLWTWIKTDSLKASQTQEGNTTDVGNGTYVARFTLRWTGEVTLVVAVVRTRQEVEYLRQSRDKIPARFCYNGYFNSGNITEMIPCHITPWMNLTFTKVKINRKRHLCNYTDPSTGSPWFCIKPPTLPCSALDFVRGDTKREVLYDLSKLFVTNASKKLTFVKKFSPGLIKVVATDGKQTFSTCPEVPRTVPECNSAVHNASLSLSKASSSAASGVYYKNVWASLQCKNSHFDKKRIMKTLQNKYLLLFGDSTVRQWFEYITDTLGNETNLVQLRGTKVGYCACCNLSLTFTFHGLPVRGRHYTAKSGDYIANRLDALQIGGPDVIIVITIWAHFTASSLEFYRERLLSIRDSIIRLQTRYPGTRVFIKSANAREKGLATLSNWFAWECDQLMRALLGNVPGLTIIDVWSMTIGHYTGFRVHPDKGVVKNEIDMLLSFLP